MSRQDEALAELPDFYTTHEEMKPETFHRLFDSLGHGDTDQTTTRSIEVSSDQAPEELRGIRLVIMNKPGSGRCSVVPTSAAESMMNHARLNHVRYGSFKVTTEGVGSRVAEYVEGRKEQIYKEGGFLAVQSWLRNPD